MPPRIREQCIRQRLNWFRKAQALDSITDVCCFFGISRKTYYKWQHRYTVSQEGEPRRSLPAAARGGRAEPPDR